MTTSPRLTLFYIVGVFLGLLFLVNSLCAGIAAVSTGEIEVGGAIAAPQHRAGALRAEPLPGSQAKPLIAYRKGESE